VPAPPAPVAKPDRADTRPLIVHVIYRLQVGGLENGVVNLINHLPAERFRHAVVCLTDFTDFRARIRQPDVPVIALHKCPGQDLRMWWHLYRLLRRWRPAIVHTRNIGCLEAQIPAWLAHVPGRVHGEHGWDIHDKDGSNNTYRWLRRLHAPLVQRFVPLSSHLDDYLQQRVGIPARKITRIYNGVDTHSFRPGDSNALPDDFCGSDTLVIGTVGRMHGVKDQLNLARAFILLCRQRPQQSQGLRLVMIGDGPLREQCQQELNAAGLHNQAWLPGARDDIADMLRGMQVFALPSQAEGISNTILEAMATGLPVVATDVGGNPDLVQDGVTGYLPPASDPQALADALARYVDEPQLMRRHGDAGLARVQSQFSLQRMLDNYAALYDSLLGRT